MQTDRRNWLKSVGIISAGLCVPALNVAARSLTDHSAGGGGDLPVRLSSNENPYGPSPLAASAMSEHINRSNRYQWEMISELMTAIGEKNNLAAANVLVGAGSTQIIDACIQLAAKRKGSFVFANPTFSRWKNAAEKLGLQQIPVQLTAEKRHDLQAMLKAVSPDTRFIYLCNPNNPTGTICKYEALLSFLKEVPKSIWVLVDEAYIDYTDERSLSGSVEHYANLIIIRTFSKIYGLAGARVGYALAQAKTIEQLGELQSGADIGISVVSMAGAMASLKDQDFIAESFLKNEKARSFTIERLQRLGINCIQSHSNFVYFSLAKYEKDFFGILKANNIEGTEIFETSGKWSRITIGAMDEMQYFVQALS